MHQHTAGEDMSLLQNQETPTPSVGDDASASLPDEPKGCGKFSPHVSSRNLGAVGGEVRNWWSIVSLGVQVPSEKVFGVGARRVQIPSEVLGALGPRVYHGVS